MNKLTVEKVEYIYKGAVINYVNKWYKKKDTREKAYSVFGTSDDAITYLLWRCRSSLDNVLDKLNEYNEKQAAAYLARGVKMCFLNDFIAYNSYGYDQDRKNGGLRCIKVDDIVYSIDPDDGKTKNYALELAEDKSASPSERCELALFMERVKEVTPKLNELQRRTLAYVLAGYSSGDISSAEGIRKQAGTERIKSLILGLKKALWKYYKSEIPIDAKLNDNNQALFTYARRKKQ